MMKTKKTKFRLLDIVLTKFGTIAVVSDIRGGEATLAFAKDTHQKIAWYSVDEVTIIGNVMDNLPVVAE
jgi:hypothetical protein